MKKISQLFYLLMGTIFLMLGFIGIILPLLPTTPFLIIASLAFVRSSKKINNWLLNHKLFGSYISNYLEDKSINKKNRRNAIIFLWCTLSVSAFFTGELFAALILLVIGTLVTLHIYSLNLVEENKET